MTNTYKSSPCPSGCVPGIKCEYCTAENSAPEEASQGASEKFAPRPGFFSPRDAADHLSADILDEALCREWIISRMHPDGARCPDCGLVLNDDASFRAGRRCHCGRCGRWYTATTDTFLEGTHLDFSQAYLLAVLIDLEVPPHRIAYCVGVSTDTVRIWVKRFKAFEA